MENLNFKTQIPIQIRWADLDPLGHVNNAVFISYFEIARGYYMLKACEGWNWRKDMFLIANVNVDYKKELLLTAENPTIHLKTTQLGNKSFVIEYALTSQKNGETILHATGSTTQIMFDLSTKSTIQIPDWVRASIEKYEELN